MAEQDTPPRLASKDCCGFISVLGDMHVVMPLVSAVSCCLGEASSSSLVDLCCCFLATLVMSRHVLSVLQRDLLVKRVVSGFGLDTRVIPYHMRCPVMNIRTVCLSPPPTYVMSCCVVHIRAVFTLTTTRTTPPQSQHRCLFGAVLWCGFLRFQACTHPCCLLFSATTTTPESTPMLFFGAVV